MLGTGKLTTEKRAASRNSSLGSNKKTSRAGSMGTDKKPPPKASLKTPAGNELVDIKVQVKKSPSAAIKVEGMFQGEMAKGIGERGSRGDLIVNATLSAIEKESATSQAEEQQLLFFLNSKGSPPQQ